MDRNAKIGAGIAAGTAAFAAGLVIAFAAPAANSLTSASEVTPASDDSGTASTAPSQGQMGRGYGHGAAALDEATTAKVKAAAESAVEGGTFKTARAEGSGYAALVSKSDGTMMLVKMDSDFQVSTVEEFTGGRGGMRGGNGETPLTGEQAEKATAAATAAVEGGTVLRVETDSDGTYEAHVRKADGTEVEVKMDADFKVTSIEEHTPGMGRGMRGGNGETPLTGEQAEKATAAAKAAVEGGTVLRVETDSDGTYEAHVRKADGTEVEVKMDADFKVTSIEEHTPGMGRGGRHGGGFGRGPQAEPSASASATA